MTRPGTSAWAAANNAPSGLWCDADTIWVANNASGAASKIFAYKRSDGTHDATRDMESLYDSSASAADNATSPRGLWSDGTTMFVTDSDDDKVFAYKLSDESPDTARNLLLRRRQRRAARPLVRRPRALGGRRHRRQVLRLRPAGRAAGQHRGVRRPGRSSAATATMSGVRPSPRGAHPGVGGVGYVTVPAPAAGSLSPGAAFTVDGDTYTVAALYDTDAALSAGSVYFDLDKEVPRDFVLSVGSGDAFVAGRARAIPGGVRYEWKDTDPSWSAGLSQSVDLLVNSAPRAGVELTTDVSAITDVTDGLNSGLFQYQWLRVDGTGETELDGETGSTYTPTGADVNKHLKVRVIFDDNAGNKEHPRTSRRLGPVGVEYGVLAANTRQAVAISFPLNTNNPQRAQGFTTGSNVGGYTLSAVGVVFGSIDSVSTAGSQLTVTINEVSGSEPGDVVCTLGHPGTYVSGAVNTYDASGCPTLDASTGYMVVLNRTTIDSNTIGLYGSSSMSEDSGSADGWSIADCRHFISSNLWASNCTHVQLIEIRGENAVEGPGVTVTPPRLTVAEGDTGTYTVELTVVPTGDVTVSVTGADDVTVSPASLTFSTATWNTAQTVTVTAAEDDDAVDDRVTVAHAVLALSATEYDGVTLAGVDVTVADDEAVGITLSVASLSLHEGLDVGGSDSYTVELASQPSGDVVVVDISVPGLESYESVTVMPTSLTFTTGTWDTDQTVSVTSPADDNAADISATILHEVASGSAEEYASVTAELPVSVSDNDHVLTNHNGPVAVLEGDSGEYWVTLSAQPTADVTINLAVTGNLSVSADGVNFAATASVTFTTADYSTRQTVTVAAAQDANSLHETETITLSVAAGSAAEYVSKAPMPAHARDVIVADDDTSAGVTVTPVTLEVEEGDAGGATYMVVLDALPSVPVSVSVAVSESDSDVTVMPEELVFYPVDWNAPRMVTVTAVADGDIADDSATVVHTVPETYSNGESENALEYVALASVDGVAVTVVDDDYPIVSVTELEVAEGTEGTYTVTLALAPSSDVVIGVATSADSDSDVTVSPTSLTFSTSSWNTAQTVTVTAGTDDDIVDDSATVTHTVDNANSDATYDDVPIDSVVVTVVDNDDSKVIVSVSELSVNEAATGTYTVKLGEAPTSDVVIDVARLGGSTDVSVSPSSLTFTSSSWSTARTVTVTAIDDEDAIDDLAVITHTVDAANSDNTYDDVAAVAVVVTVIDDETIKLVGNTTHPAVADNIALTANVPRYAHQFGTGSHGSGYRTGSVSVWFDGYFGLPNGVASTLAVEATIAEAVPYRAEDLQNYIPGDVVCTLVSPDSYAENGENVFVAPASCPVLAPGSSYVISLERLSTSNHSVFVDGWQSFSAPFHDADSAPGWGLHRLCSSFKNTVSAWDDCEIFGAVGFEVRGGLATGPGIGVSPSSLEVVEFGEDTFTAVLESEPAADVTVELGAGGDLTVSPGSLTFTAADWGTPRTVTVSALGFDLANAVSPTEIVSLTVADGSSPEYLRGASASVEVTVVAGVAGVTVSEAALNVIEGGSGTYTVALDARPSASVTVNVAVTGDSGVTVSPSSLTFSTTDWQSPQMVTVSAADDADHLYNQATVSHTVVHGTASEYGAVTAGDVAVTVIDDEASTLVSNTGRDRDDWHLFSGVQRYSAQAFATGLSSGGYELAGAGISLRSHGAGSSGGKISAVIAAATPHAALGAVSGEVVCTLIAPAHYVRGAVNRFIASESCHLAPDTTYFFGLQRSDHSDEFAHVWMTLGSDIDDGGATGWSLPHPQHRFRGASTEKWTDPHYSQIEITGVVLPGLVVSDLDLAVGEDSSGTWTVALGVAPASAVVIDVARLGGSTDVSVSPSSLTFTSSDWDDPQTVTVTAADDTDAVGDVAVINHTVDAANSDNTYDDVAAVAVVVSVADNDDDTKLVGNTEGLTVSTARTLSADNPFWVQGFDTGPSPAGYRVGSVGLFVHGFVGYVPGVTSTLVLEATIAEAVAHDVIGYVPGEVVCTLVNPDAYEEGAAHAFVAPDSCPVLAPDTGYVVTLERLSASNFAIRPAGTIWQPPNPSGVDPDSAEGWSAGTSCGFYIDGETRWVPCDGGAPGYIEVRGSTAVVPGIAVSPASLEVTEYGEGTFEVELASEPAADVTVDVSVGGDLTVSPTSLTFTSADWDTPRAVTVSALSFDLANAVTPTETVSLTVADGSSPEYLRGASASVEVTVVAGVVGATVSELMLSVPESGSGTYTVALTARPSSAVVIDVAVTGDGDVTVLPTSLTFSTTDWQQPKTVTVSAAGDGDSNDDTATVTHTVDNANSDNAYDNLVIAAVAVTVVDDDGSKVIVSVSELSVNEADTGSYTVTLGEAPSSDVVIDVATAGGSDSDVTVAPSSLTFSTSTWSTAQTVTVTAADDADSVDDTATVTHTVNDGQSDNDFDGLEIAGVAVTVTDDDPGVAIVLVKNTGQTAAAAGIHVALGAAPVAQSFTTGADTRYELESIGFSFSNIADVSTAGSELTVRLTEDDSGSPGRTLCILEDPASFASSGTHTFTAPTTGSNRCPQLSGGTTYFAVLGRADHNEDEITPGVTLSGDEDEGGSPGWSIADSLHRYNATLASWSSSSSQSHMIVVRGSVSTEVAVPPDWDLTPSGLSAGDTFRLLFVTGTANPTSTDIADYNTYVQAQAAAGHADIQDYSSWFRVVGSTAGTDARDNTATTYTADDKGVAIHWLGGAKVVDDYEDFYDGGWGDEANPRGADGATITATRVWSGSTDAGTEADASTESGSTTSDSRALGTNPARVGRLDHASSGPLDSSEAFTTATNYPYYALSGVLVVGEAVNYRATGVPTISGTVSVGEVLTAVTSTIMDPDGTDSATFTYQWVRLDGTTATDVGTDSSTYTLVDADVGKRMQVVVGFSDDEGNAEGPLSSKPTVVVNAPATGVPTISGTPRVGRTLTAGTSDIADPNGTASATFAYRWVSVDGVTEADIGTDSSTYTLADTDAGSTIKVKVEFTDDGGAPEGPLESLPTESVVAGDVLVQNTAKPVAATTSDGLTSVVSRLGQRFTTGSHVAGYTLSSIGVPFTEIGDVATVGAELTVTLNAESGGLPGEALCTLSDPATFAGSGLHSFSVPTTGTALCPELAPTTTYFVVLSRANANTAAIKWPVTGTLGEDAGSLAGWSIGDRGHFYEDTSSAWERSTAAQNFLIEVRGAPDDAITVPVDWSLLPADVTNGDRFRVLFITGVAYPHIADIAVYNTLVQNQAAAGHADIRPYSFWFRLLGSTTATDARDNTGTTYTADDKGVPIYWLGGTKVVDDYEDFYDGAWGDEANPTGAGGDPISVVRIWTGSTDAGVEAFRSGNSRAIGTSRVRTGRPNHAGSGPLDSDEAFTTGTNWRFYALSGPFEVGDGNFPPMFGAETATRTLVENSAAEVNVAGGEITAADRDSADTLTYALTGTDAGSFEIDSDGQIATKTGVTHSFDFEDAGNNSFSVTVSVHDGKDVDGEPDTAVDDTIAVTIDLTNVNEAPVITTTSAEFTAFDVDENTATSAVVKTYEATDPDADTTLTWSLEGTDAGDFTITPNASGHGELKFATVPDYETPVDGDTMNDYDVTVKVTDDGIPDDRGAANQLDNTVSVTVTVLDVNEDDPAVTLSPSSLTVAEGDTGEYTVKLSVIPTDDVTVSVTGGGDVTVSPTSLTFSTATWNTAQTVTVTAGHDDDAADDTQTVAHAVVAGGATEYDGAELDGVKVTVTDDEEPGVTLSSSSLTVAEGSTGTYTVELSVIPTGDVTVSVLPSGDVGLASASLTFALTYTELTFTTATWNTAQTVTVTAEHDDDAADDTVTVAHAVVAGGATEYDGAELDGVKVTVTDDEEPRVTLSPSSLTVAEGSAGTYTVELSVIPTGDVTVSVTGGGDVGLASASLTFALTYTELTFTTATWNTAQTVTVTAEHDDDAADDTVTVAHAVVAGGATEYDGAELDGVEVTVSDDEEPGVTLSPSSLTVTEGLMNTYTVELSVIPTADVTVSVTAGGDVTVASGLTLTFTTGVVEHRPDGDGHRHGGRRRRRGRRDGGARRGRRWRPRV